MSCASRIMQKDNKHASRTKVCYLCTTENHAYQCALAINKVKKLNPATRFRWKIPAKENSCGKIPAKENPCGKIPAKKNPCGKIPAKENPCGKIPTKRYPCGKVPLKTPSCSRLR